MGRLVPFRRPPRRQLPAGWAPYLRRSAFSPAQIRLTIWFGLLFGLLAYQAVRLLPPPYAASEPPAVPNAAERATGPVRIIDGDTFDYGDVRIRVADIDTPEVHGRCAYESDLAARATQRMRALLAAGPFELHPLGDGRDVDRYGRKLRIVTRGGRSVGDILVAEGLARTWTGRREPWCG